MHGQSIVKACLEITGQDVTPHLRNVDASGRTDRYIVNELLRRCGIAPTDINRVFDEVAARSVELTTVGLAEADRGWVLPGARMLLEALCEANIAVGLVTGNLPKIATVKLACAEIWEPFAKQVPLIAGFGDLSEDRNDLAHAALAQARDHLDRHLVAEHVVVIGDTPRDVECAQAIGACCIAVATGSYSAENLQSTKAEYVVDSLEALLPGVKV